MDNMYSSLGLGGFVNAERRTELASSLISPPAASSPSAASPASLQRSAQNLSLEEKLKLQEKQAQVSQQAVAGTQPSGKSQSMVKSQSLNMMQPTPKPQAMGQIHPMPMMNHPFLQHQGTDFNKPTIPTMSQPMQPGQIFAPSPTASTSSRLSPKPDLSAFDSLLSPIQSNQKQPMNSLQSLGGGGGISQPMAPLKTPKTQQASNATRPLSNTDINDLLS